MEQDEIYFHRVFSNHSDATLEVEIAMITFVILAILEKLKSIGDFSFHHAKILKQSVAIFK